MNKNIDGESIFISESEMPPLPNMVGGAPIAPTVVYQPTVAVPGAGVSFGDSAESGTETVLLDEKGNRCVGWLLAVAGPMEGKSFTLVAGRNSVGRGQNNKVVLPSDEGISRNSQIFVVYDPEENVYIVTPGDGSAIARLNNKRLDVAAELHHGDFIALSKKTILRFIPACDSAFKWPTEVQE